MRPGPRGLDLRRRSAAACPRRAACRRSGRWSAGCPRRSRSGRVIAGWPVTLNSDVNGVNSPERARSAIGCSPRPLQSPIASGRSASAGVSSRSYPAKNATMPRATACSCATRAEVGDRGDLLRLLEDRARERLDLVVLRRRGPRAARRRRSRGATAGPKTAMNSRSASLPGMLGAASSTSWPSEAEQLGGLVHRRARTPGRRRPRAGWRRSSRSAGGPGSRRTEVEYGLDRPRRPGRVADLVAREHVEQRARSRRPCA